MKQKVSAITRQKLRAAALLMPRDKHGVFIAKALPGEAGAGDTVLAKLKPAKKLKPARTPATIANGVERHGVSPRTAAASRKPKLSRKTLVARVSTSVERELFAVEQLLRDANASPALDAETERRARTLASLTRTLRELSQLQQAETKPKAQDDDSIPRDIDELRRELARRLDGLIADAKAIHPDLPGVAVDGTAD